MVDYSDRLSAAMKKLTVSVTALAKELGISYQAVKKVIDGKSLSFGTINNSKAAIFLKVNSHWLATGEGPMAISGNEGSPLADSTSAAVPIGSPATISVPLLSWVRAGDFCDAPGQFSADDAEELLPRPLFNTSKNTFALQVRGDSMDTPDGYREGEIVYIDPDVSPTPGRDVLAKTDSGTHGGMTLKRYKVDEEGPYLLQLNGNKIIRPVRWHVCGVVVFSGQRR